MSYDVLIKGGTIVDGSGTDRFQADVAINSENSCDWRQLVHKANG